MITWNRLSDAQKAIIQEAATEAVAWQRDLSTQQDNEYWDKIKATGKIKVTEVDRTPFMEATMPVWKQFADMVGQDNIDKVRALAD
jgi:TRAP-type C4-dicarboxylate transport system substrate-binding protein